MNGYLHSNDEIILRKLKGELRGVVEEEEDLSEEDEIIEEYETDEKDDTAVSDEGILCPKLYFCKQETLESTKS